MNTRIALLLSLALVMGPLAWGAEPKADNAACLACHKSMQDEMISSKHGSEDVTCMKCHGDSAAHVKSRMAKPDVLFGRTEIVGLCRGCHEDGHKHPDKVKTLKTAMLNQPREGKRTITEKPVCTDCHGTHYKLPAAKAKEGEWISLFNGKDLTGWKVEGKAAFKVENGCLVGTQGENGAPGDLFTEKDFGDFELVVTYKMQWPGNSGVWFRYQDPKKAYQADILEYANPVAYSGTIYCPGRLFLDINEDKSLVNMDGWNTMTIRCKGDHLFVTLNGVIVGDVHDAALDKGKLGFQIHAGDDFKNMKLTVREIRLRSL